MVRCEANTKQGVRCICKAVDCRNGVHYCLNHLPERIVMRKKKREERAGLEKERLDERYRQKAYTRVMEDLAKRNLRLCRELSEERWR